MERRAFILGTALACAAPTASRLGLALTPALVGRADEVVR